MRYGDKASVLSCISVLGDVAWHAAMRARTCGHADCGTVSKVDGVGVMPDSIPTKHPQSTTYNPQPLVFFSHNSQAGMFTCSLDTA